MEDQAAARENLMMVYKSLRIRQSKGWRQRGSGRDEARMSGVAQKEPGRPARVETMEFSMRHNQAKWRKE